jgi:hypothetical protein
MGYRGFDGGTSLLYFSTKEMQKPIYHGKTIIHEIDTQHPVDVKIANEGMVIFNGFVA